MPHREELVPMKSSTLPALTQQQERVHTKWSCRKLSRVLVYHLRGLARQSIVVAMNTVSVI